MLFGFNFQLLIALFLIPLLYASIIFFTSPYKSVTFKRGLLYLWGGMFSTVIVQLFYFFIPHLTDTHTKFYEYFAVVGPVEEISKFILFYGIVSLTKDRKTSEHPFKYMFYFAMTGLGFAILENIHYIVRYGELVLLIRTFTSTIAHMIFGLFFGYCIGLGTITRNNFEDRSVFGVMVRKNGKLKKVIYFFIGLFFSSFYHGMYNYNLATSHESSRIILIILLAFGLLMSKFLSDDLNRRWSLRSK
jgi:RsiW-degrading membrane proteinase PrsW (M82 family)